jgi:hypothetical protein
MAVDRRILGGFRFPPEWRRWREINAWAAFRGDKSPAIAEEDADGEESQGASAVVAES